MYKYSRRELILQMIANGMLIGMTATNIAFFINQLQWDYVLTLKENPLIIGFEMAGMVGILCYGLWLIVSAFKRLRITPSVRNLTTRKRIKVK